MRLIDADNLNFEGQKYNQSQMKAILDFLDAQPTAYSVEKLVEELETEKDSTYERCVKGMFDAVFKDIINKISDGGKE